MGVHDITKQEGKISSSREVVNWLCQYEQSTYAHARLAATGLGLKIPDYVEVSIKGKQHKSKQKSFMKSMCSNDQTKEVFATEFKNEYKKANAEVLEIVSDCINSAGLRCSISDIDQDGSFVFGTRFNPSQVGAIEKVVSVTYDKSKISCVTGNIKGAKLGSNIDKHVTCNRLASDADGLKYEAARVTVGTETAGDCTSRLASIPTSAIRVYDYSAESVQKRIVSGEPFHVLLRTGIADRNMGCGPNTDWAATRFGSILGDALYLLNHNPVSKEWCQFGDNQGLGNCVKFKNCGERIYDPAEKPSFEIWGRRFDIIDGGVVTDGGEEVGILIFFDN